MVNVVECPDCGGHHDGPCRNDAEMIAAQRHDARVIETARSLFIGLTYADRGAAATDAKWAIGLAADFEDAARDYLDLPNDVLK